MDTHKMTDVHAGPASEATGLAAEVSDLAHFAVSQMQDGGTAEKLPGVSFLIHVPLGSESSAIVRGLPASTWQRLQRVGYTRDEIAGVVGNSAKTIRRKENRSEPLDVTEGDRTMRLLRITVEAADAIGDADKAMRWLRRANVALSGKTPLEAIVTEAGTILVRRALGAIAYGGVA